MINIKKGLSLLLTLIPILAAAQENENQKYLAGAVPVIDGIVCFQRQIPIATLTKDKVYEIVENWAKGILKPKSDRDDDKNEKLQLYSNRNDKDEIFINFEQYLVFKSTSLSLDRARVSYIMNISVDNGQCLAKIKNFKYLYSNVNGNKPDIYTAETLITDEIALNKSKTKMYPLNAKFRKATINKADKLLSDLQKAIEDETRNTIQITNPNIITAMPINKDKTSTSPIIVNTSAPVLDGFQAILPTKLDGNVIKMVSEDWMLITVGSNDKFNTMTANWGAMGYLFNKPVAVCFISPSRYSYELMESSDTYTLTFFTEDFREVLKYCGSASGREEDKIKGSRLTLLKVPSGAMAFKQAKIIIECKKLLSQTLDANAIDDKDIKEKRAKQPMHKMYIGEILNVWVK